VARGSCPTAKVQISATDTWQVEYLVKVSRISQWYRALAYACLGDERIEAILQDLMVMQQQESNLSMLEKMEK